MHIINLSVWRNLYDSKTNTAEYRIKTICSVLQIKLGGDAYGMNNFSVQGMFSTNHFKQKK